MDLQLWDINTLASSWLAHGEPDRGHVLAPESTGEEKREWGLGSAPAHPRFPGSQGSEDR